DGATIRDFFPGRSSSIPCPSSPWPPVDRVHASGLCRNRKDDSRDPGITGRLEISLVHDAVLPRRQRRERVRGSASKVLRRQAGFRDVTYLRAAIAGQLSELPSSAEEEWTRPQENIAKQPCWSGRGVAAKIFTGPHHPVCAKSVASQLF